MQSRLKINFAKTTEQAVFKKRESQWKNKG